MSKMLIFSILFVNLLCHSQSRKILRFPENNMKNMAEDNRPTGAIDRAPLFSHYRSLVKALAVAMTKCLVWRDGDGCKIYTAKELFEYAEKFDNENRLGDSQYFMVSREGAIGISPGLEWLTKWMFIPMGPGKERDFAMRQMVEQLQTERAVNEAVERAVERGLAAERAAKEAAASAPKFCSHCGARVEAGSKFCENCGKKIE